MLPGLAQAVEKGRRRVAIATTLTTTLTLTTLLTACGSPSELQLECDRMINHLTTMEETLQERFDPVERPRRELLEYYAGFADAVVAEVENFYALQDEINQAKADLITLYSAQSSSFREFDQRLSSPTAANMATLQDDMQASDQAFRQGKAAVRAHLETHCEGVPADLALL